MIRRIGVSVCLTGLVLVLVSVAQDSKAPTKLTEPKAEAATVSPIDAAVEAELADRQRQEQAVQWLRKVSEVQFIDAPLNDVVTFLVDTHNARIRLDTTMSIAKPLLDDSRITISVSGQPLSHVLRRATQSLPDLELVWTVSRGDIVITNTEQQKRMLETRVYRVGRLQQLSATRAIVQRQPAERPVVGGFSGRGPVPAQIVAPEDTIIALLEAVIDAPWMNRDGEGGTVSRLGDQLVVRQTFHAQEQIARLLRAVETALARPPGSPSLLVMSPEEAQRWQRAQKALRRELDLKLVDTPLDDVAKLLAEQTEMEVFVDRGALKVAKLADDLPLNLPDGRYVAQDALQQSLGRHHLTAVIDDGAIRITTAQAAGQVQHTVVYDVADLLRSEDDVQPLQTTVIESTNGPWQSQDGDGGTLTDFPSGLFVIRHTDAIHTQIALLLHELRQANKDAPKEAARPLLNDFETRFYKAKTKDEAEALERLILTFVAPNTWDVSGGKGLLRVAEDRIIIQQTKTVHNDIDQFLHEYQQAKPIGSAK